MFKLGKTFPRKCRQNIFNANYLRKLLPPQEDQFSRMSIFSNRKPKTIVDYFIICSKDFQLLTARVRIILSLIRENSLVSTPLSKRRYVESKDSGLSKLCLLVNLKITERAEKFDILETGFLRDKILQYGFQLTVRSTNQIIVSGKVFKPSYW